MVLNIFSEGKQVGPPVAVFLKWAKGLPTLPSPLSSVSTEPGKSRSFSLLGFLDVLKSKTSSVHLGIQSDFRELHFAI